MIRCDRTAAWAALKGHFEAHGRDFDLREAFARDPARFATLSFEAPGVVVVDPPYEQTDERARITATLAAAHRKWAHGVTVIWYPLKDRSTHVRWKEQLRRLGIPKMLNVEHWLYDSDQPGIYNGAGLFIVGPPYAFTEGLPPMLQALRAAVAPEGHRGEIIAEWLSG